MFDITLQFIRCLGWSDCRTAPLLKTVLANVNYDVNYLRHKTGLPLGTCFSGLKIRWLQENVAAVSIALEKGTCLFGTLDSWILWVDMAFNDFSDYIYRHLLYRT